MNRTITTCTILFAFIASAATAAPDAPSVKRGMSLFGSSSLGTNGKSCATCHAEGKGLEESASYDEKDLRKIVNQCIKKALAGKTQLATGSPELASLIMYLRTLGPDKTK